MKNKLGKKGFTLVELIVVIVLLAIVGTIVIYNMTGVSKNSRETDYARFVAAVKSAAAAYADLNPDTFDDLYVDKAYIYIEVGDLIHAGLLSEDLKNPYTEEVIGQQELVKANLDSNSGAVTFEYPVENQEDETFLVALSDYVVWGEPYDCMTGAGSYNLALSEEDGSLVMLDNQETREKYNFECSMPSDFNPQVAGNYDVTYSWVTSSGTRKSTTRTLRVLAKVRPSFKTNYEYYEGDWFTPTYHEDTKKWDFLTYTPYVEGADLETTTFKITKQANDPLGNEKCVSGDEKLSLDNCPYINKYLEYPADDGDKTYRIETVVKGHYDANYSYVAEGEMNIKSKLIIPKSFIEGTSDVWSTNKEFSISDTYSPVGVVQYEYRLSNDDKGLDNSLPVEQNNVFDRKVGVTLKDVQILGNGECTFNKLEYKYIYFRAINEDGYVGDWTLANDAYLTNQLDQLIQSNSNNCSSCGTCCLTTSAGECYYCDKTKYLVWGGLKFNILEKEKDGSIVGAYESVSQNRVTPTDLTPGHWEIQTCDGLFSANYTYSSPVLMRIVNEAQEFLKRLPNNYTNYLVFNTWSAGPTAYVGNVSEAEFNKYKAALYDTKPFWTTTTFSQGFTVYVTTPYNHGNYTTKYNTYFYAAENGAISTRYAGTSAYVKPILKFKTLYVCSGDGSKDHPYVVAS